MTTYAWPTSDSAFSQLNSLVWHPRTLSDESESPLNGDVQTTSRPGSRWGMTLTFFNQSWEERKRVIAFLERLNGRQHRISFVDPTNVSPRGTIAHSGVTVRDNTAQFAESIVLTGCGAGATLKRGDWFRTNFQPLKCVADAVADGSGDMVVEFRHMLRGAVSAGAAVATNNVNGLYILANPDWSASYNGGHAEPFAIDLIEVFS